jgi:hypothetical protein
MEDCGTGFNINVGAIHVSPPTDGILNMR